MRMTGFAHKLFGSLGTTLEREENNVSCFGFLSLQPLSTPLDPALGAGLSLWFRLPQTPPPPHPAEEHKQMP